MTKDLIEDVGGLELIGTIVRLQVQTARLKHGERTAEWYDPAPIAQVPALRIDAGGVAGLSSDGAVLNDVHHRDHPLARWRGENGISIGFTEHYQRMRTEFGDHLGDGVAGENILVDADGQITEESLARGIVVMAAGGPVAIDDIEVAPPCAPFSKFCARFPADKRADGTITAALRFLNDGTRGFYGTYHPMSDTCPTIALGDKLYRKV